MTLSASQICSILLYSAAGLCVFLVLFNRFLILLPDSKVKLPVILATFLAISGSAGVAGLWLPGAPWVFAPSAVLGLILVGETRRVFIRRSCAGSNSIDSTPQVRGLFKPFTTTDLVTWRFEVPHPKWDAAPLRIVHLTDLHVHPGLPVSYFQRVLDIAEQTQPDLAVFTGDFVSKLEYLAKLREVLRPIARIETFAVLGNHDYWTEPETIGNVVADQGLRLLFNESVIVNVHGRDVMVSGYDYPWGTQEKTIATAQNGTLHLVLSHTPDNIYRLAHSSADIVFSGHYHAGQIRLPFLGPLVVPSVYGRRFDHGHFVVNGAHLFVASGIGASNPIVRIYCRPDIFIVDILGGNERNEVPMREFGESSDGQMGNRYD